MKDESMVSETGLSTLGRLEIQIVQLASRAISLCSCVAIQCMQRRCNSVAYKLLKRAFKMDLVLCELKDQTARDAL